MGKGIVVISEREALDGLSGTHVRMSWPINSLDALGTLKKYIEELERLGREYRVPDENIRLVFGFDN